LYAFAATRWVRKLTDAVRPSMSPTHAPYYKQNRLKQLRAFCQAAKTGSITEAAEALFLSQPSVTLQIQALERELDVTVFERRGPKIQLTPSGELLFRLASPLVDAIDKLPESFAAHVGDLESGELNIAAGESTILYVLPEATKRFADTYPGIRLKIHNVTGRDGMAMLRADEADFAIGSMLKTAEDIVYEPIVTYHPKLIVPPGHPLAEKAALTLEDVAGYGLILPPRHLATWRIVELVFGQYGLTFNVSLEAGGWEVIKKYVELGLGISIVTDVCLTGNERLAVRPLDDYFPTRSYGIVTRRGKFLTPAAARYLDMLREFYAHRKAAGDGRS
jgi:DNA-binding transcriptional LysR family regulator